MIPWLLGAHLFRAGQFERAAEHYRRGLEKRSSHPAFYCAQLDYAYCLLRSNNWIEARDVLHQLVFTHGRMKEAYLLLAEIEELIGNREAAGRHLEKCFETFPSDPQVLIRYAHYLAEQPEQPNRLIELREKLTVLRQEKELNDPLMPSLDTAIAHLDIASGRTARAERLLSRVIVSNVSQYEALILHSRGLLQKGRVEQARRQLSRAMQQNRHHPEAARLLAESYLEGAEPAHGDWAVQLAVEACKRSFWQDPLCLEVLREAYDLQGDSEAAEIVEHRIAGIFKVRELNIEAVRFLEAQVSRLRTLR